MNKIPHVSVLEYFSEKIVEIATETKMINKTELFDRVKIIMMFAFTELLDKSISEKEAKKNSIWREMEFATHDGYKKQDLQRQMEKLNLELKPLNRAKHHIQDVKEYQELKQFISEKFGKEIILDFFNTLK